MDKLELKAFGKINLGLDVIRKRADGYHDLDMIMQMVDVYDDVILTKKDDDDIIVKTDALILPNGKENLAYMAAKMLMDEFKIRQGLEIEIHKRIPIARRHGRRKFGLCGYAHGCKPDVRFGAE